MSERLKRPQPVEMDEYVSGYDEFIIYGYSADAIDPYIDQCEADTTELVTALEAEHEKNTLDLGEDERHINGNMRDFCFTCTLIAKHKERADT